MGIFGKENVEANLGGIDAAGLDVPDVSGNVSGNVADGSNPAKDKIEEAVKWSFSKTSFLIGLAAGIVVVLLAWLVVSLVKGIYEKIKSEDDSDSSEIGGTIRKHVTSSESDADCIEFMPNEEAAKKTKKISNSSITIVAAGSFKEKDAGRLRYILNRIQEANGDYDFITDLTFISKIEDIEDIIKTNFTAENVQVNSKTVDKNSPVPEAIRKLMQTLNSNSADEQKITAAEEFSAAINSQVSQL